MNLTINVFGDTASGSYLDAIREYEKRLSRYCKIRLVQIKKTPVGNYRIGISTVGKELSSMDLAAKISGLGVSGVSDIDFIIGSGASDLNESISLSPMDMSTGMMTVIIYEQIYRAYRILNNEPYHK